jgi:hypothetical protein
MAGIRGVKNPMPSKGEKPTGIFSRSGSQKKDPIGGGFKPDMVAAAKACMRKDPVKRDNGLK